MKALLFSIVISALTVSFSQGADKKKWTPPPVPELVSLIGKDNAAAAKVIRKSWWPKGLATGKQKWVDKTTILWAVSETEPVSVFKIDGTKIGDMVKLDDRGLYALTKDLGNYQAFNYELKTVSGKIIGKGNIKIEYYEYPPDSLKKKGVPVGKLHRHKWTESKTFPDTKREFIVYIPAQYDGSKPASLMVFQDGLRHAAPNAKGGLHATTVFDNLIASGEMPVTIGIFINPGAKKKQAAGQKPRNRSFEYDSTGDLYSRFLLEEIIPFATKTHDLNISKESKDWAIAGGSSGCACAWTAAWERPDKFGKVLGWVGTFTDIRGAYVYPALIRKTERKPIRAALLGQANDVDNKFGNWPLANRQMEAALKFSKYDYNYWWGKGFHGSRHAAVMLPEMLKWLWKE